MSGRLAGDRNSLLALVRTYVLPQRSLVTSLVLAVAALTVFSVAAPLAVARYVSDSTHGSPARTLILLALAYLGLTLARAVFTVLTDRAGERLAWAGTNALRRKLVSHALWLPQSATAKETPAVLLERVETDVVRLERVFSQLLVQLAASALLAVGMVVVVAFTSTVVALAVAGYVAVAAVVLVVSQRRATRLMPQALKLQAEMLSVLGEGSNAADELRVNGGDRWIVARFIDRVLTLLPVRVRSNRAAFGIWTSSVAVQAAGVTVAIGCGLLVRGDAARLTTVFLLLQYLDTIRQPLEASRVELQTLPEGRAAAGRIVEFLDRPQHGRPDPAPAPASGAKPGIVPGIVMRDVSFAYPGSEPVLRSVDLAVDPGEAMAVVGRTGSGKTTLLRLLGGSLAPDSGTVVVDGLAPATTAPEQRWSAIGVVGQHPRLLRESLRDNLTLFNPDCSDEELRDAIGRFGLAGWLRSRSLGLDTLLETPEDVSSGEAQLIGVIRAVLRRPAVLLLDEISARLDPQTEALLVRASSDVLHSTTSVVVTHHFAVFAACDRAVLLRDGEIARVEDLRGWEPGERERLWNSWRENIEVPL